MPLAPIPHAQPRLCLQRRRPRHRFPCAAARHRLRRRACRSAGPVAHPELKRHGQGNPRGCQGEARRRALRHRRGAHLRRHLRSRHRVPCHRRLPADPDLLRQSAHRKRLRAHRLHHRRARRHGLGDGRPPRRPVHRRGGESLRPLSRGIARADRHFRHVHPGAAFPPARSVGRTGMRGPSIAHIVLVIAMLATVPLLTASNVVLNFLVVALLIALVGQGWNVLGGYGGQYSFGHAAFFGTGAYVTAILQMRYGVNAWAAFALGIAGGALVGGTIGALTFRSGLKGSYFALVTLAFAEVLRILASVAPITGAGVGILIALDLRAQAFQFQSRAPFFWIILALVGLSLMIVRLIEQSRFGAWLLAVRENEDAARALGVDAARVKLAAMTVSAAITAAAGGFYAQYFLFVDSGIAYGPWISIEALLAPIVGGIGTVLGPLIGALAVRTLGEITKLAIGDAPGLDLAVYGSMLVLVVAFAPQGIANLLAELRARLARLRAPAPERTNA